MEGLEAALIAILVQIKSGTLEAAGADLWQSLRAIVDKRRKSVSLPSADGDALPADPTTTAKALARAAETDSSLADELAEWLSQANTVSVSLRGDVNNNVTGPVSGTVIQIGNIGGDRGG